MPEKGAEADGDGRQQIAGADSGGRGDERGNQVGIGKRQVPISFRQQDGGQDDGGQDGRRDELERGFDPGRHPDAVRQREQKIADAEGNGRHSRDQHAFVGCHYGSAPFVFFRFCSVMKPAAIPANAETTIPNL